MTNDEFRTITSTFEGATVAAAAKLCAHIGLTQGPEAGLKAIRGRTATMDAQTARDFNDMVSRFCAIEQAREGGEV